MKFTIQSIFIYLLAGFFTVNAQPSLLISEGKVTFEPGERIKELTIINKGTSTGYYDISFAFYTQKENLTLEESTEGSISPFDLRSNLKVLPRKIKLPAGDAQKIRILHINRATNSDNDVQRHTHIKIKGYVDNRHADSSAEQRVSINQVISIPILMSTNKKVDPEFLYFDALTNRIYFEKKVSSEFRGRIIVAIPEFEPYEKSIVMYPEVDQAYIELPNNYTVSLNNTINGKFVSFVQ